MTISEVVSPGDKVDINLIQDVEQKDVELAKTHKSKVLDFLPNGNIEIAMPIKNGKLVLLPLGIRFELTFYSMGNLYKGIGVITERYKRDNVYTLEIELKSQLERFQRREYYRYSCVKNVNYYVLTEEEAKLESANAIFVQLNQKKQENEEKQIEQEEREKTGLMVDLSGGGMKLYTAEAMNEGQHLLISIHLTSRKSSKQHYVLGKVISCEKRETREPNDEKYEIRLKFLIDDKIREDIIKYIFEEERKIRQKEKG